MGIIQRQTIQSSVYTYAGVAVGFLTQGIFFPNLFSKAQVGLLSLLISLSLVLAQLSNLGTNGAGGRYFPYFRNAERQHNGYLFMTSLTTLIGFGLCVLGLWLARPWIIENNQGQSPLFVDYYYLLIPLTLFTVYFTVFDNYARLLYDPVTGTLLQQFVQRVLILLAGITYWLGWVTFPQFLGLWLLAFFLQTVLMIFSVARDESLFLRRRFFAMDPELRRNLTRYAALTLTTALSSQIILTIDKVMINNAKELGLSATGVYSIAASFATVIAVPATALYKVSGTLIAESWKSNDLQNITKIYSKSCLNQLIAGCLVFVGVAANLPNVFQFLPAGYEAGYYVILWLGLGKLIDMATGINGIILNTSRYYIYDSLFFVALTFFTIAINYYLIPRFGINGAAIGGALATLLYNLARTLFVGFAFRMQPFTWRNVAVIVLAAAVWWLSVQVSYPSSGDPKWRFVFDIAWRSALITTLFGGLIVGLKLSSEVNQTVAGFRKRFLQK
ncbi:lipopolysaccharide biosynthesis protein [Spirosoma validum]|uniref:Polysaccharide biosynthesis C-terminal domain-containing protein n=1 Tax=Spirosoma validum TaxID=2771355 RepID=A0A927B0E5_9BACT|nr:polysaccharide biosynthesis C-terminal domain-containing protein [Spirosoma validum]MBD2753118.1 polysaccharide biosynthesis C-terminal domain-containing protein [Spirosoma validum]